MRILTARADNCLRSRVSRQHHTYYNVKLACETVTVGASTFSVYGHRSLLAAADRRGRGGARVTVLDTRRVGRGGRGLPDDFLCKILGFVHLDLETFSIGVAVRI